MLFNSHIFIFGFLPVALLLFFGLGRTGRPRAALAALLGCSIFFYGWWNPSYLGLIGASVVFNYLVGRGLGGAPRTANPRRALLWLGVSGNLLALGYFKYANFFVDTTAEWTGAAWSIAPIVLPLAISFFTFQQIAYLVDCHRDEFCERNFLNYCVFVTFFPQLIAGPIVHHREMLPQFRSSSVYRFDPSHLQVGLSIFFLGLFKKVVMADGVAVYSTPIFDAAAAGTSLTSIEAWSGALAYTLQLYFDFSGYSDMAIGLGRLFGIRLPVNFDSPYKATSIIEFWRRWHMTLSRFLREYLYIPLGGNRHGAARRYLNVMITMLLGGLWHGAGWTFIVWGGVHGLYLLVNHGWRVLVGRASTASAPRSLLGTFSSRCLTFSSVVVGWVFFRADSLDAALHMLRAMGGLDGQGIPAEWSGDPARFVYLTLLTMVVFLAPNTMQIMSRFEPALTVGRDPSMLRYGGFLSWRPTRGWAFVMAFITVWGVLGINRLSEFLYFQF